MAWCLWQQPHPGAPQSPRRRTKDMPGAQGSPRDSGAQCQKPEPEAESSQHHCPGHSGLVPHRPRDRPLAPQPPAPSQSQVAQSAARASEAARSPLQALPVPLPALSLDVPAPDSSQGRATGWPVMTSAPGCARRRCSRGSRVVRGQRCVPSVAGPRSPIHTLWRTSGVVHLWTESARGPNGPCAPTAEAPSRGGHLRSAFS